MRAVTGDADRQVAAPPIEGNGGGIVATELERRLSGTGSVEVFAGSDGPAWEAVFPRMATSEYRGATARGIRSCARRGDRSYAENSGLHRAGRFRACGNVGC